MNNIHTYAKITKDEECPWYHIYIYKTNSSNNELTNGYKIPFVFPNIEMAKDFVSILPDKIEEFVVKDYDCDICHLCYKSYKTYKLTIGDILLYVRWDYIETKTTEFFGTRKQSTSTNNLVRDFVYGVNNSIGYNREIQGEYSSTMISNILNYIKKKKQQTEEYTFELIQQ